MEEKLQMIMVNHIKSNRIKTLTIDGKKCLRVSIEMFLNTDFVMAIDNEVDWHYQRDQVSPE